jgi:thiol-disulfide isomerase/thioredoxin
MLYNPRLLALVAILLIFRTSSSAQLYAQKDYGHIVVQRNQEWNKHIIKLLNIGDTIPNFLLEHVDNWRSTTVHLRDFKKQLTIVDFWGIGCSSCIRSMPEDEKIQAEFGDKIQILMVTRDNKVEVDHVKTQSDYVKKCSLPMYNDDKEFYKYFVFSSVPQMLWIDGNGVIIAEGFDIVDRTLISNYFEKHIVPPPQNRAVFFDFDRHAPGFVEGYGRNFDKVRYYSVIMDTMNGLGGTTRIIIDRDSMTRRIRRIIMDNYPLNWIWDVLMMEEQKAEGEKLGFVDDLKRTLFEVSDTNVFRRAGVPIGDFHRAKEICYELQMPDRPGINATTFMRTDLERHFGITWNIEKRDEECWVLQKATVDKSAKLSRDQAASIQSFRPEEKSIVGYNDAIKRIVIKNTPLEHFLYYLQQEVHFTDKSDALPIVVSDTDTSSMRDFNLLLGRMENNGTKDKTRISFDDLRQDMEAFGYRFVRKRENIPMVIIKDIH